MRRARGQQAAARPAGVRISGWGRRSIATKMMCEIIDPNALPPRPPAPACMFTSCSPFAKRGDSAEILNPCPSDTDSQPATPTDGLGKNQTFSTGQSLK